MFRNLRLQFKFLLLASLTPLAVAVIAFIAVQRTAELKYEFDNLYGFMLLPIMDLDEANLHREKLSGALELLARAELSEARAALVDEVRKEDAAMLRLHEKYETEWVTTVSPEFTAVLRRMGRIALQEREVALLGEIDAGYAAYGPIRDRVLAGLPVDVAGLGARLDDLEADFAELVAINKQFADLSNESAQGAIRRMYLGLGISGALLVLAALAFAVFLARLVVRQVATISQAFSRIGMGDFKARAQVLSKDELGRSALSFNAMLDNTLSLIQSREDRDRMQRSIQKLLEEVSGVAEGDLTREAAVTADVTGAIADSFNVMIVELRRIIASARDTTLQVSSTASEIQSEAEHLAQGSEHQALQIVDTSAALDELAASVQQVSENASQAATVADQALRNARQGGEAVVKTMQGMTGIRQQVQETAKRIKRLGESSQEIGEIVQLIGDIADRTSILALNASIQAAMAGEAGRGFAVVAEEVERLAERSAEATKRIGSLIKAIQSETGEAVAAMEATTREVVGGSALANEAGRSLEEIQGVSQRLAEIIQSISLASRQQARGSESVAKAMTEISEVTQQTAAGTKQAAVSIKNLAELADDLRESIDRFRLPSKAA